MLQPLCGMPLLAYVLHTATTISDKVGVVVSDLDGEVANFVKSAWGRLGLHLQAEPRGTGHAVRCGSEIIGSPPRDLVVLFGDTPFLSPESIQLMISQLNDEVRVAILGFKTSATDHAYGRLILDQSGNLEAIVEHRNATPDQLEIQDCNSGMMALDGRVAPMVLAALNDHNAQQEFVLSDAVAICRENGYLATVSFIDEQEALGVNTSAERAQAEAIVQNNLRQRALESGVRMNAPMTVFFAADTELAPDVEIGPYVVFGPDVKVERDVRIESFCHIEGARLRQGTTVGPFARIRPGSDCGPQARIGNFVEVKNTRVEQGAKANHLSYLGDGVVGECANIGAGTIFCNYDGTAKHQTEIGPGAFIGSNTALVAPISVGANAVVGAGSTITEHIPADTLALGRARQVNLPNRGRSGPRFEVSKAEASG